ncbi:DUF916 and DUF3324 domain-containing protein [Lacticaseibacillus songhuajiangensis]|uniref:DUF916 and DUF3324 domain-containing protein n=1 Tax=Lacticaseibacillus songhuajiangensis TaxID=1296539 RepID=UPI000F774A78|nr:DUF916 and DUF3324 domain-containing protein [Lacticaseibacillus songhuajiangensis]
MKTRRLWLALLAMVMGIAIGSVNAVYAASSSNSSGAGYTVTPVIESNQINDLTSYFDVLVKPGSTQNLSVNITNTTNADKKLRVSLTSAYTTDSGVIGYDPNTKTDPSAKYYLSKLGSKPVNVTVPAGKVGKVTMKVNVPKNGFKGVLLGSVYVADRTKRATNNKGMTINNRYALVVGVQMQTTKLAQQSVRPDLKLMNIQPGMQNNKPAVLATIQNYTPTFFGQMDIVGKVSWRNSSKTLFQTKQYNYAMAPTSHFAYGIFPDKGLNPGDYTLDLTAKSGKRTWHFKKNFTILAADANRINKKAGVKVDNGMPWWVWMIIILLILLLIALLALIIILLLKRRKKDDEETK